MYISKKLTASQVPRSQERTVWYSEVRITEQETAQTEN